MSHNFSYYNGKVNWVLVKIGNIIGISLLFLVSCLPVVTIGAACAALYSTVHRVIRHDRDTLWSNYWRAFRTYFKKTTIMWLILLVLIVITAFVWLLTYGALRQGNPVGLWNRALIVPILYIAGWMQYLFTYPVRFQNTTWRSMKMASALAVMNLHWTIVMMILMVIGALSIYLMPLTIAFSPALVCLLDDLMLEKAFRRIMAPEDLQKEMEREAREKAERWNETVSK